MSKYLLLDCSSIMSPYKYVIKDIDKLEGIVDNFFKQVLRLSEKFDTKNIIFVWEGSGMVPYRKQLYPAYKKGVDKEGNIVEKDQTEEEIAFDKEAYFHFGVCREIVEAVGFKNSFSQAGTEADDVLAIICQEDKENEFVMVTSDEDMFQCLQYNCSLFMFGKKKFMNRRMFEEKYNISPEKWHMVKAIGGCSSDKVPSPKGVGEGTAIKFLNGELKPHLKSYQAIMDYKFKGRNKKLVTIPIPQTKPVVFSKDEATMEKVVEYCYGNGKDNFLNETFEVWEKYFKKQLGGERRGKK